MKAIKIYNIIWNLDGLTDEQKTEAKKSLPRVKCFTVKDDFVIAERVPSMFQKKYGYPVESFSSATIRVVCTTEELLELPAGSSYDKSKKLFSKTGEITEYGQKMIDEVKAAIKKRKNLEEVGMPIEKIPAFYDEVMIAIENITGMEWMKCTAEEIIQELDAAIEVLQEDISMRDAMEKERQAAMRKRVKMMNKEADDDDVDDEE